MPSCLWIPFKQTTDKSRQWAYRIQSKEKRVEQSKEFNRGSENVRTVQINGN